MSVRFTHQHSHMVELADTILSVTRDAPPDAAERLTGARLRLSREVSEHCRVELAALNARRSDIRDARAVCDRLGIAHYDFAMSARRELSAAQAEALIALMRAAPKPVLIHCEGGADRAGLAAALLSSAVASAPAFADTVAFQGSPLDVHVGERGQLQAFRTNRSDDPGIFYPPTSPSGASIVELV